MGSGRRVLAVSIVIAAILILSYVLVRLLPGRTGSSVSHPKISADECRRALGQVFSDVFDRISTPEPAASAATSPAVSVDPNTVLATPECRRFLRQLGHDVLDETTPNPAVPIR